MQARHFYSLLTRKQKKLLFIFLDVIFLPISLWSAFALRFSDLWPSDRMEPFWWMFFVLPVAGVLMFARLGLYRAVIRYMGDQAVMVVVKGVLLLSFMLYVLAHLSTIPSFPRSIPINFAIVSCLYVAGSRYAVKFIYQSYVKSGSAKEAVLIYGAGQAGAQLAAVMSNSKEFLPVGFIDDDDSLHGQIVSNISVHSPAEVEELVRRFNISRVVLAVPAASTARRNQILNMLRPIGIHIQTVATLAELAAGTSSYVHLHDIQLDDLLGRDVVVPNQTLLSGTISNKVILVTGAGGSIGSELCRQITLLHPKLLILYDNSEHALYSIDSEMTKRARSGKRSGDRHVAILGSVQDSIRVTTLLRQYKVQTVFHAAAYKHVPIVEQNILEGVRNNIFGTRVMAEAALAHDVERFILISTDKAVRPTNIMGATKRVAEQVVQSLSDKSTSTVFTMVRFGNVLGSSGSVVPLFHKQIKEGGPVTVTDKNVTRYFMSIPEAAQLVIQAGALAKGGEVFVLNMGEPVKIYDLARRMIELSGLHVRDQDNPTGDIDIEIIGLRPGEKMFEELLIGEEAYKTEHVRIMRAKEEFLDSDVISGALIRLECAANECDTGFAREILKQIVHNYRPEPDLIDLLIKSKN